MKVLRKYWWILALQGLFLAIIGAIGAFSPNVYIKNLVEYLGVIFLAFGGLMAILGIVFRKKARYSSFMLIMGILQLGFGFVILYNLDASAEIFTYVIGGWAFIIGIIQAVFGLSKRGSLVLNLLNAAISLAFAALIIWNPFDTGDALKYLVSFYSILLGIMVIYYSFSFKNWSSKKIEEKGRAHDREDETPTDLNRPSD